MASNTKQTAWTDREFIVYLWALIEDSGCKFDYNKTPRPGGRSPGACNTKVWNFAKSLKDDVAALRSGQAVQSGGVTGTAGVKKRKARADSSEKTMKRAKKTKVAAVEEEEDDDNKVKEEVSGTKGTT
ncbi:hypothetical protein ACN47E_008620 [Coniothyrium glycines]